MKTIAAIKNELFKDYLKVVSTDNLEQTLDNPAVPVPFSCIVSVQNQNSDKLAVEINKFFEHRKIKNKDFLAMSEEDLGQLQFFFNLIKLSSGGEALAPVVPTVEQVTEKPVVIKEDKPEPVAVVEQVIEKTVAIKEDKPEPVPVAEQVNEKTVTIKEDKPEPLVEQVDFIEPTNPIVDESASEVEVVDTTETAEAPTVSENKENASTDASSEHIESLGIPKNSIIHFIKNEDLTATLLDEKTVVFDDEELPIVDATKKAFKKSGMTGMALGLSNWSYEGTSLKTLKDKK